MPSFRTEIDIRPDHSLRITHDDKIVMLGSCFTDNVGERLEHDGFDAVHNPMGPLYNPASILNAMRLALTAASGESILPSLTLATDADGQIHCLDFASKYAASTADELTRRLTGELTALGHALRQATILIVTLGTSYVYEYAGNGCIVGNCHKFPATDFSRRMLTLGQAAAMLGHIASLPLPSVRHIMFTVSPIRHVGDGLHNNQLSKSTLLLAVDQTMASGERLSYFPAYEIMMDDLRDYRFYAADMKHPSDVAIDYIYQTFGSAYFSKETQEQAQQCRRLWTRSQHRPILQ